MDWAYKGMSGSNGATGLVQEFIIRQKLSKLGYSFDIDELSSFKAMCFGVIADEVAAQERAEMKKSRRR